MKKLYILTFIFSATANAFASEALITINDAIKVAPASNQAKTKNLKQRMIANQLNRFNLGAESAASIIYINGPHLRFHYSPYAGFSAGLSFQYNFPKILSIHADVVFERKGQLASAIFTNVHGLPLGDEEEVLNLNYLVIPLLARANFGSKIQFFVNAGPYFSALLNSTFIIQHPHIVTNFTYAYKRFDTGISSGIGLTIPLKSRFSISIEGRNNTGLYNIAAIPTYNNGKLLSNSTNFICSFAWIFGMRAT